MYSKSDAGLLIRRGDGGDSPVTEGLGGPSAKLTFTSVGAGAGASQKPESSQPCRHAKATYWGFGAFYSRL